MHGVIFQTSMILASTYALFKNALPQNFIRQCCISQCIVAKHTNHLIILASKLSNESLGDV